MLFLVLIGFMAAFLFAYTSPDPPADEYPFSYRTSATLTYASGIDVVLKNTLTVASLQMGGSSATINLSTSSLPVIGDRVVFIVTADNTGTKDTLIWGANFTAPQATVDSIKTKTFEFIYNGTAFNGIGAPLQLSLLYRHESVYNEINQKINSPRDCIKQSSFLKA